MERTTDASNLDEPIWGVENIAREIKRTPQQVYHMIRAELLPGVRKVGARYVSTRRKLRADILGEAA